MPTHIDLGAIPCLIKESYLYNCDPEKNRSLECAHHWGFFL